MSLGFQGRSLSPARSTRSRPDTQHDCHLPGNRPHRNQIQTPDRLPISENLTVCGQSTMIWDGSLNPFSGLGVTSIRMLMPILNVVVIGRTVA
jgi:hypothetical protein